MRSQGGRKSWWLRHKERDLDAIGEANALFAVDDEQDPGGSSTAFARAHVASLLARTREELLALDQALERLEHALRPTVIKATRICPAITLRSSEPANMPSHGH